MIIVLVNLNYSYVGPFRAQLDVTLILTTWGQGPHDVTFKYHLIVP